MKPGPRLQALIDSGIVTLSNDDYQATASDGVVVSIADKYEIAKSVEHYLREHPTPDTW